MSGLLLARRGVSAPQVRVANGYETTITAFSSLVSYWPLDGSLDATGNALDLKSGYGGVKSGGITLGGVSPGALTTYSSQPATNYTGGNYLAVADTAALRITGDLTILAWVKPTDRANYYEILTKTGDGLARPYEYRLEQTSGKATLLNTAAGQLDATTAPSTGAWSMVAVTRSGTTITHYLNGSSNGSGTLATGTDNGTPVNIGARVGVINWKGALAHVAILNAALTGTDISNIYAAR